MGALRPAAMSTCTNICSPVASSTPVSALCMAWKICRRFVCIDQLERKLKRIAEMGFGKIEDHALHCEQRISARPIGLVNSDQTEERIRLVAEYEQIARFAHMPVIVHPIALHGWVDQI